MESKFYQANEHRAEKVHELFATIARRYDFLNDVMSVGLHRRWKRRLVELAGDIKQKDVLDLCCGTGDIARLFAQGAAEVIGADFTEEMLRVAQGRCSRESHSRSSTGREKVATGAQGCRVSSDSASRLQWTQTDALRLPFRDNSFDVVSVGYGLRNLADIELGLCEILRVLKPGGKFVSLDLGKPESKAFRAFYFGYLRIALPILGRLFCGDPDTHGYILTSLQDYPAQRGIKELMEACGYRDCGFEEFCLGSMATNFGVKV